MGDAKYYVVPWRARDGRSYDSSAVPERDARRMADEIQARGDEFFAVRPATDLETAESRAYDVVVDDGLATATTDRFARYDEAQEVARLAATERRVAAIWLVLGGKRVTQVEVKEPGFDRGPEADDLAADRITSPLQWTRERPKVEGWYWCWRRTAGTSVQFVIDPTDPEADNSHVAAYRWFAGPIPEPLPPDQGWLD